MTTTVVLPAPRVGVADGGVGKRIPARRPVTRVLGVVGVVVAGWLAWRSLPSWERLVAAFSQVSVPLVGLAAVVQVGSLVLFARQQQVLLAGFGVRVPTRAAVAVTYSRSAMSMTLPGGSVVSALFAAEQFRRFGASRTTAATVTVLSGVVSLIGLAAVYGAGFGASWAVGHPWAAAVALGVVAAVAWPRKVARVRTTASRSWWGRLVARVPVLPTRSWLAGVGYSAANWGADLACLVIVAEAFGLGLSPVRVAVLYLGVQLARQIPISPGGIGVVEAGLIAGLVLLGVDAGLAAAVTLVYRFLSCWLVIPPGLLAWIALTRGQAARSSTKDDEGIAAGNGPL